MDIAEYIPLALRTAKPLSTEMALKHAVLGLASDGGEVLDVIKAHAIYGQALDRKHLAEELGDTCWFAVYAASSYPGINIITEMPYPPRDLVSAGIQLVIMNGIYADIVEDVIARLYEENMVDAIIPAKYATTHHTKQFSSILSQIISLCAYMAGRAQLSLWEDCLPGNIAKLRKRYPEAYSDVNAAARADKC